jgi:hypothetical protein
LADPPPTYKKAMFESQALSMVLLAHLPFHFVKDPEFINFLNLARSTVKLLTHQLL